MKAVFLLAAVTLATPPVALVAAQQGQQMAPASPNFIVDYFRKDYNLSFLVFGDSGARGEPLNKCV